MRVSSVIHKMRCFCHASRVGFAKRDWLLTELLACTLECNSSQLSMASCVLLSIKYLCKCMCM
jgi:hypothetical protein